MEDYTLEVASKYLVIRRKHMSAIDDKYAALGGPGGFLGQPTSPEQDCPDHRGRFRHFQNGSIYWSPESGAHEVHGLIRAKWAQLGWEKSFLAYPVTDETSTPDNSGRYNHFQNGSIYWRGGATEAFEVHGLIRAKWAQLGWEKSFLGYPVTDETSTPDSSGRYNHFQAGSIYWRGGTTEAFEVHGAIRNKWETLGRERSALGYPTTDEGTTEFTWAAPPGQPPPPPTPPGRPGRYSDFQHGSIYWSRQTGAYVISSSIPQQHRSSEAEVGRRPCLVHVTGGWLSGLARIVSTLGTSGFYTYDPVNKCIDVSPLFPEWPPVEDYNPVVLEGEVVWPSSGDYPGRGVSFKDLPISHYTHDFDFAVRPDPTPDNRYTNLLGIQVHNDGTETRQDVIGVEWETGLGASNDGNPLQGPNTRGESGGFFSAAHRRGEVIWNWPTLGDRVHVEGLWIWDRGHPPADTEIHPPRLVAIQRHLPVMTRRQVDPSNIEPSAPVLATRVDIFASGDGSAIWNNRLSAPPFVAPVFMNDRNYEFRVSHILPRPSPNAKLKWIVERHPGDTYPLDQIVAGVTIAVPPGQPAPPPLDYALVRLPWHSHHISNTAVLARTVYLYWDEGLGVPADYRPRVFRVTVDDVFVHKSQDIGDGEYRLFVEVGGNWIFVNEIPSVDNILDDGLGDTGDNETWPIHRQFKVYVPPGGSFRVHACGWEADGVNDVFGKLLNPNHPCDESLKNWLTDNLFTEGVWANGGMDDPIGQVNTILMANRFGVGIPHEDRSSGPIYQEDPNGDTDPNDSYRLHYLIEELPWPSV
jgi:hypothetical protein